MLLEKKYQNDYVGYSFIPAITHPVLFDQLYDKPHNYADDSLDIGAGKAVAELTANYYLPYSDAAIIFYSGLCPEESIVFLDSDALNSLESAEQYLQENCNAYLSFSERQYFKDAINAMQTAMEKRSCKIRAFLHVLSLAYGYCTQYAYRDRKMLQQTAAKIIALFRCKNGWQIAERFFLELQKMFDQCRITAGIEEDAFKSFDEIEHSDSRSS